MFPRKQRLSRASDITRVYRKGKKASEQGVLVSAAPRDDGESRFTVVISKKFSNRAVKRNQQKRLLLSAARKIAPDITKPSDITISYNKSERMLSYNESHDILKKAFKRLAILS